MLSFYVTGAVVLFSNTPASPQTHGEWVALALWSPWGHQAVGISQLRHNVRGPPAYTLICCLSLTEVSWCGMWLYNVIHDFHACCNFAFLRYPCKRRATLIFLFLFPFCRREDWGTGEGSFFASWVLFFPHISSKGDQHPVCCETERPGFLSSHAPRPSFFLLSVLKAASPRPELSFRSYLWFSFIGSVCRYFFPHIKHTPLWGSVTQKGSSQRSLELAKE